jgi:hypothetical protein
MTQEQREAAIYWSSDTWKSGSPGQNVRWWLCLYEAALDACERERDALNGEPDAVHAGAQAAIEALRQVGSIRAENVMLRALLAKAKAYMLKPNVYGLLLLKEIDAALAPAQAEAPEVRICGQIQHRRAFLEGKTHCTDCGGKLIVTVEGYEAPDAIKPGDGKE